MKIYSIYLLSERVGFVCAQNKVLALTKTANMFGFADLSEYVYDYPGHYTEESEIMDRITRTPDYFYLDMYDTFKDNNFLLWACDSNGQSCVDDLVQCAKNIDDPRHWDLGWFDRTLVVPTIHDLKSGASRYLKTAGYDKNGMWFCEDWTEETK